MHYDFIVPYFVVNIDKLDLIGLEIRSLGRGLAGLMTTYHIYTNECMMSENYMATKSDNITMFNVKEFCRIRSISGHKTVIVMTKVFIRLLA